MIYFFIFIYLLYLTIHYDILEKKDYKWTHYKIVITLLILVAGFRWRVGSDTVLYAQEFYYYHDLLHLEWSDFSSIERMPLWVLLNATCKTIWDNFLLVQFVVAAFSLGVTGYFIKKICPSLCFFVLLCYFAGVKYTLLHMELMRESLAISFYLLGILAINRNYIRLSILYALLAVMFHIFAFVAIVLFIFCYYILPYNNFLRLSICCIFLLLTILDNDFMISIVSWMMSLYNINGEISSIAISYLSSDKYGNSDKNILNYIWLFMQFITYIFMIYKSQKVYSRFVLLKRNLFDSIIFICIVFLCIRYSFSVLYRIGENYNYILICVLPILFTKGVLLAQIKKQQRSFLFLILLLIPLFFYAKYFVSEEPIYGENRLYLRYYPYSSIFQKIINEKRESLHQLRGGGYSKENTY